MPKSDKSLPLFDFRSVEESDRALLTNWTKQSHWIEWWGKPETVLEQIFDHIESVSVEPLIVELNGKAIAYLQSYDPHLEDNHPYADQPFGTMGVDLCIGPEKLLNADYGAAILSQFSEELFEEGAIRIIIDPHPENERAIKSFQNAGFHPLEKRDSQFGSVLLMARDYSGEPE